MSRCSQGQGCGEWDDCLWFSAQYLVGIADGSWELCKLLQAVVMVVMVIWCLVSGDGRRGTREQLEGY